MELRNWKKILLLWISECGFIETNYFNLEQSEIDTFFKIFWKKIGKTKESRKYNIKAFLRDHYSNFEIHLDDENALSSADYVYVYSLLLHFCCVKYPETYFHDICKKLPDHTQQSIASYFKALLDCNDITRETLRHTIGSVIPKHESSPQHNNSSGSSNSISSPSVSQTIDSPTKTPLRTPAYKTLTLPGQSPATPKSVLLEERTREIYSLRAQLETERYEKGLLEAQLKQNDEKISKLNQEHSRLLHQVQGLRNEILIRTGDATCSTTRDSDEQIKRRLCKEISQKEGEISKLTDILSGLNEEKHLVQQKLEYTEKLIKVSNERIKDLEDRLDELAIELQEKNQTIDYLTNNKIELEQFIAETRTASNNSRRDLNNSNDFLESSLSRTTNTSGSINSTENLGCSVIDIQLREKEHENIQLREELEKIRDTNNNLANNIRKLTIEKCEEYHLEMGEMILSEDKMNDPENQINYFSICMDKLGKYYKDEKNKVIKLKEDITDIQNKNDILTNKMDDCQKEINMLNDVISRIESMSDKLEKENIDMQSKLAFAEKDIKTLNTQKFELVSKLESLANEFDMHIENNKVKERDLLDERDKLHAQLQETSRKNSQLKDEIHSLQIKMHSLQEKFIVTSSKSELEMTELNNIIQNQNNKLENYRSNEQLLKEQCEKCFVQIEAMKNSARESDAHLEVMRSEIATKESEMSKLGIEIVEVSAKNAELEQRIDKLMNQCRYDKKTSDMALNRRDEHIKLIENEKSELQIMLNSVRADHHKTELELKRYCDEMKKYFQKMEMINKILSISVINDVHANLEMISEKVRDLQIHKLEAENQIECLEFDHLENNANMKTMKEKFEKDLSDKDDIIKMHVEDVTKTKNELRLAREKISEYENEIETIKDQQKSVIDKLEESLRIKEENLIAAKNQYEEDLMKVRNELNIQIQMTKEKELEMIAERDDRVLKDRELIILHTEHNFLKSKLNDIEIYNNELQDANIAHETGIIEKCKSFESQTDSLLAQNSELHSDIESLKLEHNNTKNDIEKAIEKFIARAKELRNALMFKDDQIKELKSKIDNLEAIIKIENDKLNAAESHIVILEGLKTNNCDTIKSLEEQVSSLCEEKEKMMNEHNKFSASIMNENEKKSALLIALQNSITEFQNMLEEKDKRWKDVSSQSEFWEIKINELSVINENLQAQVKNKENEIRIITEAYQNDEHIWENKLSEIMRKMSRMSENIEKYEIAILDIINVLKNTDDLTRLPEDGVEMINAFGVQETELQSLINQLRHQLNCVLHNVAKMVPKKDSLENYIDMLTKANGILNSQLAHYKSEVVQLQEKLQTESNKLANKIKDLNENTENLVGVNERLSEEIGTLQEKLSALERENLILKHRFVQKFPLKATATLQIQDLSKKLKERDTFIAELKEQIMKSVRKPKDLQPIKQDLSDVMDVVNKNEIFAQRLQTGRAEIEMQFKTIKKQHDDKVKECLELKFVELKLKCNLAAKANEIASLKKKLSEISKTEKRLEMTDNKFENMLNIQNKLTSDLALAKTSNDAIKVETNRLQMQLNKLKQCKNELFGELEVCKNDLERANDKNANLLKQVDLLKKVKNSIVEENGLLKKQLQNLEKDQIASETRIFEIIKQSETLEMKILLNESELNTIKNNLEQSNMCKEKLNDEHKKWREMHETLNKRIEKQALKLGESQARVLKLERDNEKYLKMLASEKSTTETLQRDKEILQSELKALKDRTVKYDRSQEILMSKLHTYEQQNINLYELKVKQEGLENEAKIKINRLEKMKEANEEKIRKLDKLILIIEKENVRMNLEIGALNSEISELKGMLTERNAQMDGLKESLAAAQQETQIYEGATKELKAETENLREQNIQINAELSKVSLSLQMAQNNCEKISNDFEVQSAHLQKMRCKKDQIEKELQEVGKKLKDTEETNRLILSEKETAIKELDLKMTELRNQLDTKIMEITDLTNEIFTLRSSVKEKIEIGEDAVNHINALRTHLKTAEELLEKEKANAAKLLVDNQILQAKYRDAKQRLLDEIKVGEDRIRDNRLELEGKLEKMKNKMKTLYNDETSKIKSKHDREVANLKSEMEIVKLQNTKYEEHIRKLSSQIVRLNDRNLEEQKQNAIISTKLNHLESSKIDRFKRPSSIHVPTVSSTTSTGSTGTSNLGSNLAMEDEEGEVFNNTYLTDLKSGRMSLFMNKDVCAEELQYRNSLVPPHLKSTYAAQYDHGLAEDDLKDGPHSLDDSLSVLLSTTTGNVRKKVSGVTHYKRPGPPTPSKNGGRLSFGGNLEPAREILKETYDNTNATVSSSKTPARFGFFASRFSMGNIKDELKKQNLRNAWLRRVSGPGICSSTPRKSQQHFEQRQLIHFLVRSPHEALGSPVLICCSPAKVTQSPGLSIIEKPNSAVASTKKSLVPGEMQKGVAVGKELPMDCMPFNRSLMGRVMCHWRNYKKNTPNTRDTTSSAMSDSSLENKNKNSAQTNTSQYSRRKKRPRPSLNLHGGIFGRKRIQKRKSANKYGQSKARRERFENFDQFRFLKTSAIEDESDKSIVSSNTICLTNSNSKSNNFNSNSNQNEKYQTVVLVKHEINESCVENWSDEPVIIETHSENNDQVLISDDFEHEYNNNDDADVDVDDDDDDNGEETNSSSHHCVGAEIQLNDGDENDIECIRDPISLNAHGSFEMSQNPKIIVENTEPIEKVAICEEVDVNNAGNHFERLLVTTESQAPFEINPIDFDKVVGSSLQSSLSNSDFQPSSSNGHIPPASSTVNSSSVLTTSKQSSTSNSRTIYGRNTIFSSRIPNIRTSIANVTGAQNDTVNHPITLMDLFRMLSQMDISAILFVSLAPLITFLYVLNVGWSKLRGN